MLSVSSHTTALSVHSMFDNLVFLSSLVTLICHVSKLLARACVYIAHSLNMRILISCMRIY